jgi:apolipoprotein D and lipocalin family protein
MVSFTILALATAAAANAVPAVWDGSCYYPKPDIGFDLNTYLGRWYQVAGTIAPYTANCKCIFAQYDLNVSYLHQAKSTR